MKSRLEHCTRKRYLIEITEKGDKPARIKDNGLKFLAVSIESIDDLLELEVQLRVTIQLKI